MLPVMVSLDLGAAILGVTTMVQEFSYPAVFQTDEAGRVLVSFPDFPHAHTDGANVEEAFEESIDCLGSVLAEAIGARELIPSPSKLERGERAVPVPFWIAGKLALYLSMRDQGISNSELARRLGVRETTVRRMLNPDQNTRMEKIQAALHVLGKRVVVAVRDAA